ncbi:MAG: cytidine deaminase [Clostridiales Family XIII bacterium]|nr:cytidine deaminase [Clostridiales Family XIII bacterium]
MPNKEWVQMAIDAREHAYVPYSNFRVGAALVAKDGTIFKGCNIENASYGLSNCAERTAFFKAVSEGKTEFLHLIVSGDTKEPISPCGACRQVMSEFCDPNMPVTLVAGDGHYVTTTVEALLPYSFSEEK